MRRRIIYIVKSDLDYYPPCISQIRMLHDLGAAVEVWFGSCNTTTTEILDKEGIPYSTVVDPRGRLKGQLDIALNWAGFRRALLVKLRGINTDGALLWFGTAESAMPMIGALNGIKYVVSALELYDDLPAKKKLMGILARNALAVTACELSRAYIMKSWWNLPRLPYVFPNKPYGLDLAREIPLTCAESKRVIADVDGRDFVIYQGILQNEESVTEIAHALNCLGKKYLFVLMGIDRNGIADRIKSVYGDTLYYESIPSPKHLEVTSRAHIGCVFYDGKNLNKAFCAPNKIYEYSSFGLPMLANKMPGLINTVGACGGAECIDLNANDIQTAIERIDSKYEQYSLASRRFFDKTDNSVTMSRMLDDNDELLGETWR